MSLVDNKGYIIDPYRNFIHTSRYARWLDDKGRRETWAETVARYVGFMRKHMTTNYGYAKDDPNFDLVEKAILEHEIMPSMRALMAAGPAMEADNICAYNCLGRETEFITQEGVRRFSDFKSGDKVTVLTHTGAWKPATVRSYGEQRLYNITISRGRSAHTVRATKNHQWILADGSRTTNLQPKDQLARPPRIVADWDYYNSSPTERIYWALGFVYGDGTLTKNKSGEYTHSMVRLCGENKMRFLDRFQELGYSVSSPASWGGDAVAYTGHYLKALPTIEEDGFEKVVAFVRGYLDADGNKNLNGEWPSPFSGIQASKETSIEFIRKMFPAVGAYITQETDLTGEETNYGIRPKTSTFGLVLGFGDSKNSTYSVQNIQESTVETVWCLEVEDDHSFVLPNGIVTGNCSFIAVDSLRAFDEAMYILMNGTGVGFSVEQEHVKELPVIADEFEQTETTIVVEDSKMGWAKAYKELISLLVNGQIPNWDTRKVRPAGARLKTFGGRASGPEPLKELFRFTTQVFKNAKGRRLKSIEAHDIMCKIGEVVVVGGVRRSALISLSNLDDFEMAKAKSGQWWESQPQRALANNSAVYDSKPNTAQFLREWRNLYESKSGERGIYNAESVRKHIQKAGRRDASKVRGTNPCAEILLRSLQFCNLTEIVIRAEDTEEDLLRKVELATILGTWQSTLTNFKYIRKAWKNNCEEERLLGVSLTGIFGNKLTSTNGPELAALLNRMRERAIEVNQKEAEDLGIQASTAITCVKPSGTVSQLVGVSSGIHPWHSEYYLRSVRADNKDPLTTFLKASDVPSEPEALKPESTTVFSFPIKAPEGAIVNSHLTAVQHLELWKTYRECWTEHNPSVTISVREDEWMDVGAWVYKNFDHIGGVSFLPATDHIYRQAPYQEITKEQYEEAVSKMPAEISWNDLSMFETEDSTSGTQELACSAGVCEIVDITSTAK
jgi:ribonucleoside-diphosphate reductase alpha chain